MDKLGRYYTETMFSELLISQLRTSTPSHILDLGVGDGSLLNAALNKWDTALGSAIDIEDKDFSDLPRIKFFKIDLLISKKDNIIGLIKDQIDIAICNPPYKKINNSKQYLNLFRDIGFEESLSLKYFTTDLLFLAFNLSLLKAGGQLGIILPDTLITSHDFELFRRDLLKYDIVSIIELPERIFKKTEAKTYILVLNNTITKSNSAINLLLTNKSGEIIEEIKVQRNKLANRMDYTYNSFQDTEGVAIGDLGAVVRRGRHSKKYLSKRNKPFFHTSSFRSSEQISFVDNNEETNNSYAQKDDILIARVGSRTLGQFYHVKRGKIPISDCVLKVTLPKEYVFPFLRALNSDYGKRWFKAHSHGVCAKLISKRDLLEFKLPFPTSQTNSIKAT